MNFLDYKISNPFRSSKPAGFYDKVKGHTGEDYICPVGTDVVLPIPLYFLQYLNQNQMGKTLYMKDNWGNVLVFSHLSEILVLPIVGKLYKRGTVLAKTGNTGTATTNPHLHLEIIAKKPSPGLEFMTRSLGGFSGYNIPPSEYLAQAKSKYGKIILWMYRGLHKSKTLAKKLLT